MQFSASRAQPLMRPPGRHISPTPRGIRHGPPRAASTQNEKSCELRGRFKFFLDFLYFSARRSPPCATAPAMPAPPPARERAIGHGPPFPLSTHNNLGSFFPLVVGSIPGCVIVFSSSTLFFFLFSSNFFFLSQNFEKKRIRPEKKHSDSSYEMPLNRKRARKKENL